MVLFICSFAGHPQGARAGAGFWRHSCRHDSEPALRNASHPEKSQPAAPAASAIGEASLASPGLAKQAPPLGPSGIANGFEMD